MMMAQTIRQVTKTESAARAAASSSMLRNTGLLLIDGDQAIDFRFLLGLEAGELLFAGRFRRLITGGVGAAVPTEELCDVGKAVAAAAFPKITVRHQRAPWVARITSATRLMVTTKSRNRSALILTPYPNHPSLYVRRANFGKRVSGLAVKFILL